MTLHNKKIASLLFFIFLLFSLVFGFGIFNGKSHRVFLAKKDNVEANEKNSQSLAKESLKDVKILFAGDLMLDRYNRVIASRSNEDCFTKNINDVFLGQDLSVVNLEGPVTGNESVSIDTEVGNPAHFKFTFDKKISENFLTYNKINLVNLGNNHILNFGKSGAEETVKFLKENKVGYFGSPLEDKNIYIEKEINGLKIALVNYNQFYKLDAGKISAKIKDAKNKNDFVIVYAHWGNEYELRPSENQRNIAHNFIDSGADLIIGSHPHVVQPIEVYKNKAIFYSLGNFVFDQFFSEDVKNELIVTASLNKNKMEFVLTPLYRGESGQLIYNDKVKRQQLLERLATDSLVGSGTKEQIKRGFFSL